MLKKLSLGRDIYYIDPAYFKSQSTIDSIIDDIAYTIGVDRVALNVVRLGSAFIQCNLSHMYLRKQRAKAW